jgi:tetratricopeptide (TPR) repeat protein
MGEIFVRSGQVDRARTWYTTAIAEHPDDDALLRDGAAFYVDTQQAGLAIDALESRIRRAKGQVPGELYFYLGIGLEQVAQPERAAEAYSAAVRLYPSDPRWQRELERMRTTWALDQTDPGGR